MLNHIAHLYDPENKKEHTGMNKVPYPFWLLFSVYRYFRFRNTYEMKCEKYQLLHLICTPSYQII